MCSSQRRQILSQISRECDAFQTSESLRLDSNFSLRNTNSKQTEVSEMPSSASLDSLTRAMTDVVSVVSERHEGDPREKEDAGEGQKETADASWKGETRGRSMP
ncbi:hypothetical protein K0M31_016949 [Melipona bicolor]|uniref:Uncharacterized protein n=1 Tax=Melipona bicolor TaxID=60889 RepID=A0AA40FDU1_9HYME|nr:hypothetical protein K0M31_016949 [Melipona bicolor]